MTDETSDPRKHFSIGHVASVTGVNPSTLRSWEQQGLIEPAKSAGGRRTFSDGDIRRIAEISKLFIQCGIITINCFISPTNTIRAMAKQIIGDEDFMEVYMNSSLDVCEARDTKGLYARARRGEIKEFTGIDSPFEAPEHPDLELKTDEMTIPETIQKALDFVLQTIQLNQPNHA